MKNIDFYVTQLESNLHTIQSILNGKDQSEYNWKKNPTKWSLLEIICHLVDEEKEDFKVRLQNVLNTPDKRPPSIDPVEWVQSRKYADQDFEQKIEEFRIERIMSIEWLKSLQNKNWDHGYEYGKFGFVNGQFFMNNWLAHDYLHIRQMTRVNYDYLQFISKVDVSYAGQWVAD